MVVNDIVVTASTCVKESVCITVVMLNYQIQKFVKLKVQTPKCTKRRSVYCRLAIITMILHYFGHKKRY